MPEVDADKIGTTVTYLDPNGKKKPVRIQGVSLKPNEATDLADFFHADKAKRVALSLALNPHFQVEGGPDNSEQLETLQQNRFQHEQEVQATYQRQLAERQPYDPELNGTAEPPPGYTPPGDNMLVGEDGNAVRTAPDDEVPTPTRKKKG
jgi:hypothetical protein